ncbi:Ionotropic receptor 230, partial [Frankliniella occidentalis]
QHPTVGEINSVEELLASGLPIKVSKYLELSRGYLNLSEAWGVFIPQILSEIKSVARGRKSSLIMHREHIPQWLVESRQLHLIDVPMESLVPQLFVPRMSPLAEPLRRGLMRVSEAGLLKHWEGAFTRRARKARVNAAQKLSKEAERAGPLRLEALRPPLLLLFFGQVVSVFVWAAEVAGARY